MNHHLEKMYCLWDIMKQIIRQQQKIKKVNRRRKYYCRVNDLFAKQESESC